MRTAIEIIAIRTLIKEFEEIKVWIGIKLLIESKETGKSCRSVVLLKLEDFRREL